MPWAAGHQYRIIIRPASKATALIQLDDLTGDMLDRLRRAAFLGLENQRRQLRRVSAKHLQSYIDEFEWRFNGRDNLNYHAIP